MCIKTIIRGAFQTIDEIAIYSQLNKAPVPHIYQRDEVDKYTCGDSAWKQLCEIPQFANPIHMVSILENGNSIPTLMSGFVPEFRSPVINPISKKISIPFWKITKIGYQDYLSIDVMAWEEEPEDFNTKIIRHIFFEKYQDALHFFEEQMEVSQGK